MSEVYKLFGYDPSYDYSEDSMQEAFESESLGKHLDISYVRPDGKFNGFIVGKHWMDVTVKMWRQDIKDRLLFKHELYRDPKFPHWWLDRVLK